MVQLTQSRVDVADHPVTGAMSRPASAVAIDATLHEALRAVLDAGPGHVVVVDPTGRFMGILGDRHLVAAWAGDPPAFVDTPVMAVLDSVPPTVAPTATLRTVARVMRDHRSDVVVVTGTGRVAVGVVTAGDLVAAIADGQAGPGSK